MSESAEQLPFIVKKQHDITNVQFQLANGKGEVWFLLRSDAHFDSPWADNKLEMEHLKEAKARNAGIIDCGDLFDAMGTPHDKRRTYQNTATRFKATNAYLNALSREARDRYMPYAKNFVLIGKGNHESAVEKHCGFSLSEQLVNDLVEHGGSQCRYGDYDGFIRFSVRVRNMILSTMLYYTHGSGGASPVTQGTIKSNRRAVSFPNADIIMSGHTHTQYLVYYGRRTVSHYGVVRDTVLTHVQTPTYLTRTDHETENEHMIKPRGAFWIRFYARAETVKHDIFRAG